MRRSLLAAAILFTCITSPLDAAPDAVLQQAQGRVLVRARGEKRFEAASSGAPLLFGDEIKTLKKSSAHVVFASGDAVLVKENARFALEGSAKDLSVSFSIGEFLIGLKRKLAVGESFQVRTPAAVAAVRGTLFWGLSDLKKDSTYASFASPIEITAQGKTVVLFPGQTVKIELGKAPGETKPAAIPLTYLDTFSVKGTIEGMGELVAPELKAPKAPEEKKEKSLHDL